MSQTSLDTSVPEPIVRKLQQVRKRKMYVHFACAVVAALAVLLAAMCVAMLIDWLATLYDSRWRVVLTTVALLAAVLTTFGWFAVAWRRALGIERIAGDVDRQLPQLEERWTTMTRLGADAANPEVIHPAMLRRVANEAASWEPVVEPNDVVSLSTLARTMLALTAITAVLAVAVVLDSQRTLVLVRRFWAPGSSISATQLVDVPGNVVVGRGEPLALEAKLEGVPVENATLLLSTKEDSSDEIDLVAHGDKQVEFSHRLRAVEEPFRYRFRAGDGQTEWYTVGVADRPEIAQLQVVVRPPEYTRRKAENFDHLPRRISAMQKSTFEISLRSTIPVDRAELEIGEHKRVPLVADNNGWYRWNTTLDEAVQLAPKLTESHGLTNRRVPVCDISVYEDRPPAVKVLSPSDEMAVRPDDTIQITFAATDDVGIGSAELLVYESQPGGEPVEVATIPIPLEEAGALSIQKSVDLDLKKFAAQDGAELSYEIRVREQRGQPLQQSGAASSSIAANNATKPSSAGAAAGTPNRSTSAAASSSDAKTAEAGAPSTTAQSSAAASTTSSSGNADDAKSGSQASTDPPAAAPAGEQTASSEGAKSGNSTPDSEAAPGATAIADANEKSSGTTDETTSNSGPTDIAKQSSSSAPEAVPQPPGDALASDGKASKTGELAKPAGELPKAPWSAITSKDAKAGSDSAKNQSTQTTGEAAAPTSEQASSSKAGGSPTASTPSTSRTASKSPPANDATKSPSEVAPRPGANMPQIAATDGGKKAESVSPPGTSNDSKTANGRPTGAANSSAKDMAKNERGKAAGQKKPGAPADETPRTASSGRKGINSDAKEGEQPESTMADAENGMPQDEATRSAQQVADSKPPAPPSRSESQPSATQQAKSDQKSGSSPKSDGSQQSGGQQQNSSAGQTASSDPRDSSSSDRPSGDSMTRRSLDVGPPQSSTSQRMKLKVDKWAGSFSGQQRAKLEMAIGPELEALDQALAKAQRTARGVLEQLAVDAEWRPSHDREVTNAEKQTVEAQGIIDKLEKRSKGTPYAFVGLQVVEIGLAHVEPARNDFWKTLEADGGDRSAPVRDAVQHLTRARELVKDLRGRFEVSKREFQLAESVEKVKQMYQVYVENSLALLQTQENDPQRYSRKMAQFDLDDEYLKRLKEVLEMRADLQKELARILADDPRLLRRFMDSLRNKSNNLREELADLVARQGELNREVRAWSTTVEAERPQLERTFMLRHMQRTDAIATAAGKLQERYETWLPLNRESQDADLAAATKRIQDVATAAVELNAEAMRNVSASQAAVAPALSAPGPAAPAAAPAPTVDPAAIAIPAPAASVAGPDIAPLLQKGQRLYEELAQLDVALRQIAARDDDAESASFAANRLIDTRRLIADSSAWQRQMNAFQSGKYTGAAEVEQYRLAMKTEELAGKLGGIEQQLAAMLEREDGSLPAPIANKAREFLATLDREASPNQLAAVYALHGNIFPRATYRQQAAGDALTKAEKQYDELMKLAIAELDKLPVQDPIASLLDDPTLDELLAQLEQELRLEELLGIPPRSSNLRIIDDWLRPGSGGGGGGQASSQAMASNQVRADQQRAQQQLDQAYKRTIKRALKETAAMPKVEVAKPARLSDWNQLVSKLGDDLRQGRDKAPPEQYRRAIEQYFSQISREVAAREEKSQ